MCELTGIINSVNIRIQGDSPPRNLGRVDKDLQRYPDWWADSVSIYCPSGTSQIEGLQGLEVMGHPVEIVDT